MKKGLSWFWIVLVIAIVGIVATVAFVFKIPFKFGIESGISEEELKEFVKKESQMPENYILEQTATTNMEISGDKNISSYFKSLASLYEIKATFKTMKKGEFIKTYTEMEKPNRDVTIYYDYPDPSDDYKCEKIDGDWFCGETLYVKTKPEFLEMLGMGYFKSLEEALGKKDLVEIHGTRKKCFGHDCVCVSIDARKLLEENIKKTAEGEAISVDKFLVYSCMEEKSKLELEMKTEFEISFRAEGKESHIKIIGNVNTLRFEETEPPIEEFRLPTKGEKKILYVCENCEYNDLKKALKEANIGDTIMITDKREYEGEESWNKIDRYIIKDGVVIDCGGSTLKVDYIHGEYLVFKNCTLIAYDMLVGYIVTITDSTINAKNIDIYGQFKLINSKINGELNLMKGEGIEIRNNQINVKEKDEDAITLYDEVSNVSIKDNVIKGGIGGILLNNVTDISIVRNKIIDSRCGVRFGLGFQDKKRFELIKITGNTFTNVTTNICGIIGECPYHDQCSCTNDAQCSQACTSLCPPNVYGCCYTAQIGRCLNGECKCVEDDDYCCSSPKYQVGRKCFK